MTIRYLRMAPALATLAALFFFSAGGVQAQQKSTADAIAEYRASLQDGNPADLNAARGEVLWKNPLDPKMRAWKLVTSVWALAKSRVPSRNYPGTLPMLAR